MKLPVITFAGAAQGEIEVADDVLIQNGKGSQALHDTVVAYLGNQRLGTAKVKQMGEVHGTGKKPWKQKGTGRARAGSFQSPIWRGGAVVFGPHPRDYSRKLPKKVKALAFRKALSERLLAGDVIVLDALTLTGHKTKSFVLALRKVTGGAGKTLVVTETVEQNLRLAARNVPDVQVEPADSVNAYELLRYDKIVATRGALEKLKMRISPS